MDIHIGYNYELWKIIIITIFLTIALVAICALVYNEVFRDNIKEKRQKRKQYKERQLRMKLKHDLQTNVQPACCNCQMFLYDKHEGAGLCQLRGLKFCNNNDICKHYKEKLLPRIEIKNQN